jgi:hypothetical protein
MNETQKIKNSIISARILLGMAEGKPANEAFDSVLGEGAFDNMVSELYEKLRAKAAN